MKQLISGKREAAQIASYKIKILETVSDEELKSIKEKSKCDLLKVETEPQLSSNVSYNPEKSCFFVVVVSNLQT